MYIMTSNNNNHANNENAAKKYIHCNSCSENNCRENMVAIWINDGNDVIDSSTKDVNTVISLPEIRELYGFDDKKQPIDFDSFYKFYEESYKYDKDYIETLYLHYLLVIGNYIGIHKFIIDFINSSSIDRFERFVNSPLYIPICKKDGKLYYNNETRINKIYHLYPVTTSIMWNNKPEILRLLISFGAVLDKPDNFGCYPEEAIRFIPYFNPVPHLDNFEQYNAIKNNDVANKIYCRNIDEFKQVVNEVRYITGEDISQNWFYPI